jgi:hypothetical protein
VTDFADWLATEGPDGITRLCTMVGALVLARATKDSPLSDEILDAARAALTAAGGPPDGPDGGPADGPDGGSQDSAVR